MRILFVTNYYPPSNYGWGYMQLCEEVADGLSLRGHSIAVLTSTNLDGEEAKRPYPVCRHLRLSPDWQCGRSAAWQFFVERRWREQGSLVALRAAVRHIDAQVIVFWHYIGIPRIVLHEAEQIPGLPVAYYLAGFHPELSDEYAAYWRSPPSGLTARALKSLLAKVALRLLARSGRPVPVAFEHVMCVSEYVRTRLVSQDLISTDAVVIHNGVDPGVFSTHGKALPSLSCEGLRALVAGHLIGEKGTHTAIEALALVRSRLDSDRVTLDILGDGPTDYVTYLQRRVSVLGLQEYVQFLKPVPRSEMPSKLANHNVLLLPSEYDEPLARAMQEAMSMGLLVIGTTTGGSGELLLDGKTGLAFEPRSPESLARKLLRVIAEPAAAKRLALAGQRKVRREFTIERTIDQVERYLIGLASERRT